MYSKNTYQKTASHEAKKGEFETCLLLYSGGLDTSVMLKWIQESYECDIIALTIDLGQTADLYHWFVDYAAKTKLRPF